MCGSSGESRVSTEYRVEFTINSVVNMYYVGDRRLLKVVFPRLLVRCSSCHWNIFSRNLIQRFCGSQLLPICFF